MRNKVFPVGGANAPFCCSRSAAFGGKGENEADRVAYLGEERTLTTVFSRWLCLERKWSFLDTKMTVTSQ
ncbi:hypothetical protein SRHO_G00186620 [Serrasalmus rhombeus]